MGLPTGVVTYLLTDIEGSTAHWNDAPDAMAAAVARHQQLIAEAVEAHGGVTVPSQGEGDSTLSAFARPGDALAAAAAVHAALERERWLRVAIRVRVGIHTGEAELRDGTYYGVALNRTGRLRSLGNGGQTVVSAVTAELAAHAVPEGLVLHDAGSYVLKGLPDPQRVYALAPAGDAAATRLAEPPTVPIVGDIPAPPTAFIGRDEEVARLVAAATQPGLVTITGPGGAGKTRMALQVAREAQRSGRPVLLVDLAPVRDAAGVPGAIVAAAGSPPSGSNDSEAVIAALGGGDRLVVLDNCEHVADAVADLVGGALAKLPLATFVVTSQVVLGVDGERVHPLGALPIDDAVALFVDRASRLDGEVDAVSDRDTIAEICARLDHLPLAIELAAGHVRMLTPAQILARLDDDVLAVGNASRRTANDRQRSLRTAVEWSVGLIDDDERRLLSRLAVFRGGFTLAAAEAVCSDDDLPAPAVLDVLGRLVDRSLVARRRRGDHTRFWLLETIRTYAWEQLGRAEAGAPIVFRRDGETWALTAGGATTRVRDSTGLRYLAELLRRPGVGVPARELAGRPPEGGLAVIDDVARREYRERLADLEQERDDAAAANDGERRARAEVEIDALVAELSRAAGLGGRARVTGDATERARVSVTKAIRHAIRRIDAVAPEVAAHLDATISTGTVCRYDPPGPPGQPVRVEP